MILWAPVFREHSPSSMMMSRANVTDIFFLGLIRRPSFCMPRRGKLSISSQEFSYWPWAIAFQKPLTCRIGFRGLASSERCIKCCLDSKCCLLSKRLCSTCCLCSRCCLFSKCCLLSLSIPTLFVKLSLKEQISSRDRQVSRVFSSRQFWGLNWGHPMSETNALLPSWPSRPASPSNAAALLS